MEDLRPFVGRGDDQSKPVREWLGMTYWALSDVCERMNDRRAADQARANGRQFVEWAGKKEGPFPPGMWPGGPPWVGKKEPPPKKDKW